MIIKSYNLWSINDNFSNKNSDKHMELLRDGKFLLAQCGFIIVIKIYP